MLLGVKESSLREMKISEGHFFKSLPSQKAKLLVFQTFQRPQFHQSLLVTKTEKGSPGD